MSCGVRTRLTLPEIVDKLRQRMGSPEFSFDKATARLTTADVEVELEWSPFEPKRTRNNLIATVRAADRSLGREWGRALDDLCEMPPPPRFEDHFHLHSQLSLDTFCARLAESFALGKFTFDSENDNEWAIVEDDDCIVHVSHAYEDDTYHEWQPARCPRGSNYWIVVTIKAHAERDDREHDEWRDRWMTALAPLGSRLIRSEP